MKTASTARPLNSTVRNLLGNVRGGATVGGLFAGTFAVLLLLLPASTDQYFAWTVRPPVTAAWIGAAYIFRTYFFWVHWRTADHWRRIGVFQWGNFLFSAVLILATLIHRDRFNWHLPSAWIWLILYLAEPLWVLYLIRQHSAQAEAAPATRLAPSLRTILAVEAAIFGVVGTALFLVPERIGAVWPWQPLTPLNARAMAAWALGWAVWAGSMTAARDWFSIRLAMQTQIVFGLALILALILYLRDFDFSRAATWLYVGFIVVLSLLAVYFYWREERAVTPSAS